MRQPDPQSPVVVLGAGIVGICTALSLLERGVPVTVMDKGDPGQETSMGNAGVVSPWSFIPQAIPGVWKNIPKLMFGYGRPLSIHPKSALRMLPWGMRFLRQSQEEHARANAKAMSHLCGPSIELYQKHLKGTGHENLLTDSMYVHAFRDGSRATLDAIDYQIRTQMGADLELVGRDRLTEIEPSLGPDFNAAVLIKGQARMRSPGKLGQVLAEKAKSMGAEFRKVAISRIHRKNTGSWAIQCDGETVDADRLVLCLGAWSPGLLTSLGISVPLMAERGYHVEFGDVVSARRRATAAVHRYRSVGRDRLCVRKNHLRVSESALLRSRRSTKPGGRLGVSGRNDRPRQSRGLAQLVGFGPCLIE